MSKPDTLKNHSTTLDALLDAIERAQASFVSTERRTTERKRYRHRLEMRLGKSDGTEPPLLITSRDLSAGGIGFIYGGYLRMGLSCNIELITLDGTPVPIDGHVVYCRHVRGRIHQVGVRWNTLVHVDLFVPNQMTARILLADDTPELHDLVRCQFAGDGVTVIGADSGAALLDRAQSEPTDLVLVSVNLPDSDGCSIVRILRERGLEMPIVCMSDDDSPSCARACFEAGADDFLTKPLDHRRLAAILEAYIGDRCPIISGYSSDPQIRGFIVQFISTLRSRVDAIREKLIVRDAEALVMQAREIRAIAGGTIGCGFDELADAARELEQATMHAPHWPHIACCVSRLCGLARRVRSDF